MLDYSISNIGVRRATQSMSMEQMLNRYFLDVYYQPIPRLLSRILTSGTPKLISKTSSFINTLTKVEYSVRYSVREWMGLVDLATMVGYPKQEDRIFSDNVKAWLQDEGNECHFSVGDIRSSIAAKIHVLPVRPPLEPFDQWVLRRQNWIGPGSMNLSKLELDGVPAKTKLGFALSATDREVLRASRVEAAMHEGLRAFVKPDERGVKGRYIISAPFSTFVRMKYLSDRLEAVAKFDPRMNLFRSTGDTPRELMSRLESGEVLVPLDFQAFDYHISSRFWVAWFSFLRDSLPECSDIIDSLAGLLGRIPVRDVSGDQVAVWMKGMPSGFYWTAFLDSLFNLVACDLAFEGTQYSAIVVQGDDCVVSSKGDPDLNEMSLLVDRTGMVVNVQKNWYAPGTCEFLKVVYTGRSAYQYPARAFATLLWAYPSFAVEPSERLSALASSWKEYLDRCPMFNVDNMVDDLHRATVKHFRWPKRFVREWLHTAPSLGGFGLTPLRFSFRFKFRSRSEPVRVVGLRFRRYPFSKSMNLGLDIVRVSTSYVVHMPNRPPPSLDRVVARASWATYIEYMRAVSGLRNRLFSKPLRLSTPVTSIRLPHWSDAATENVFGKTRIFVAKTTTALSAWYERTVSMLPLYHLLWK